MLQISNRETTDFKQNRESVKSPSTTMAVPHEPLNLSSEHPVLPPILSTKDSPKEIQTLELKNIHDANSAIKQSISSQSSTSSQGSADYNNSIIDGTNREASPLYIKGLLKRARTILDEDNITDDNIREVLLSLTDSLQKVKAEANHYKIRSDLLSISSKDADMRYEVENELIKTEVDRLKKQGNNVDYLMNKINHQKQTLKKYKNEIINKNKEIIMLRSSNRSPVSISRSLISSTTKKRKKSSSSNEDTKHGLNTLGMLASQVLTEEEQQTRSFPR